MSETKDLFAETMQSEQKIEDVKILIASLANLSIDDRAEVVNQLREAIHEISPFKAEPVDFVKWVKNTTVTANDYNPNSVAPPEMKLLEHSITEDGYTQPIVSWKREEVHEVVDGFHRHRVGKESDGVRTRVHGYLPVVIINNDRLDKNDRMASTIRHNRARGEHKVESMSEIVMELKRRFWSDEKIATELGMEPDEVLRLQQVSGLASIFEDEEFSQAWEAEALGEVEGEDQNAG